MKCIFVKYTFLLFQIYCMLAVMTMTSKNTLLLIILFMAGSRLFAQHVSEIPEYALSDSEKTGKQENLIEISIDTGVLFGTLYEYVFSDNSGDDSFDYMVSRLDWNIQPIVYSGITACTRVYENIFGGIGVWFGYPMEVGYMEDRDWNYDPDDSPPYEYTGDLNMYSWHRSFLYYSIFADMNMGYGIINDEIVVLTLLVGFTYKRFHFYGMYGHFNHFIMTTNTTGTYPGKVIEYEQNWFVPYIGTEILWQIIPELNLRFFLCVSPFLSFVYARDLHLTSDTEYLDFPSWGFYTAGKVSVSYLFLEQFAASMDILLQWSPPFKGDSYSGTIDSDLYILSSTWKGGAACFTYGLSIKLTYLF